MITALERLDSHHRVLVAGCGGGFDVFAGLPLATRLLRAGKTVVMANLSFTELQRGGCERILPAVWRVDRQSRELTYFPEKWLVEWLARQDFAVPVYAFERTAPSEVAAGYRHIVDEYDIDLVVLVDGGTDSVLFGDEPALGTLVEDAVSIVAANSLSGVSTLLAAIGFGIDHFHGVSHHSFLENTSTLIRDGGYLGSVSVTPGSREADDFLDAVDFTNKRYAQRKSIVLNSIASSLRGEFGDYHATDRTIGSELFINPLMAQYWFYSLEHLVRRMSFAEALSRAQSWSEAHAVIERASEATPRRPYCPIPL